MKFPYRTLKIRRPVYPLGGLQVRYRPVISIEILGPLATASVAANLDTGSDDTLFPSILSSQLGINLVSAPQGESVGIGGVGLPYDYAMVRLRLSDSYEEYEWEAIVGFMATPMPWAVLGYAGMQQFFDIELLGHRRELILTPNASFPGQVTVLRPPPP